MLYQVIEDGEITESYSMPDHDDTHHTGSASRDSADGLAGLDTNSKILKTALPTAMCLTVSECRDNNATGTANTPERANDNSAGTAAGADAIGEYIQILFNTPKFITEIRQIGTTNNNGSGVWKIQTRQENVWVDNTTNIPCSAVNNWGGWTSLIPPVYTQGIRLVSTTLDTKNNQSFISELEGRG